MTMECLGDMARGVCEVEQARAEKETVVVREAVVDAGERA